MRVVLPNHWVDSTIYWVLNSFLVRVGIMKFSQIDLVVDINAIMQQTSKLQLPSTTSNSILSQEYNRSKDSIVEGYVKLRCGTGYSKLFDLMYNDRSSVNFELYLVKLLCTC